MPNLMCQCEVRHGGRHADAVVDEKEHASDEVFEGLHAFSALWCDLCVTVLLSIETGVIELINRSNP